LYGTIPSGDIKIYDTEKERTEALELFKGDAVMQLTRVTNRYFNRREDLSEG